MQYNIQSLVRWVEFADTKDWNIYRSKLCVIAYSCKQKRLLCKATLNSTENSRKRGLGWVHLTYSNTIVQLLKLHENWWKGKLAPWYRKTTPSQSQTSFRTHLHRGKTNAKVKRIKEPTKENFRFNFRFRSVWMDLYNMHNTPTHWVAAVLLHSH